MKKMLIMFLLVVTISVVGTGCGTGSVKRTATKSVEQTFGEKPTDMKLLHDKDTDDYVVVCMVDGELKAGYMENGSEAFEFAEDYPDQSDFNVLAKVYVINEKTLEAMTAYQNKDDTVWEVE